MNYLRYSLVFSLLIVTTGCAQLQPELPAKSDITSYEECAAAGNIVTRSYPPQCVTKDGRRFIQKVEKPITLPKLDLCKDLCGDGTCQEIVCMATGCPCAETAQSCPKDCR